MEKSIQDVSRSFRAVRALSSGIAIAILGLSPPASAAVVYSTGTVAVIYTYPEFGGGDFTFRLSTTVAGCEGGFWISPSQPGFKTSVAFVMQARATGEVISAGGNNALIWNGSGSSYCKLDWVGQG